MFKKDSPQLTFIANGSHIKGKFRFDGDVLLSGHLDGQINSKGNLVIEKEGYVKGKLFCIDLQVSGYFQGSVSCQRLIIHNEGSVEGEVWCEYMEIYDQGQFVGVRVKETPSWLSDFRDDNDLTGKEPSTPNKKGSKGSGLLINN
jgi:cytoskeletal protein CcmA (bactofilin family)